MLAVLHCNVRHSRAFVSAAPVPPTRLGFLPAKQEFNLLPIGRWTAHWGLHFALQWVVCQQVCPLVQCQYLLTASDRTFQFNVLTIFICKYDLLILISPQHTLQYFLPCWITLRKEASLCSSAVWLSKESEPEPSSRTWLKGTTPGGLLPVNVSHKQVNTKPVPGPWGCFSSDSGPNEKF